ncbi:EAL domain-containing protein [Alteromonas facilis]|uniref:EAL domain-containing protein n=1 Tax=Alteromonas facilis TaxID=2048004 RepID=UPI000C28CF37|nr:EAL domain-containing protein [Alteromonas facilis]
MPITEVTDSFSLERIVPFFQPIIDMQTNSVWRYECLARLINEQEHTFLPNEFLFIVERNNWCQQLTETMLLQCAQYFRHVNIPWNINLDTTDLQNPNLLPFIRDALEDYPNPHRISIEITAHAALRHESQLGEFVDQCNAMDIGVFIDNLGETPVNVQRLLTLPINGVKLSGKLINHYQSDSSIQDFVEHICEVAEQRGVNVVAEHIESESSLPMLEQLSIRYAQGFLFSRPNASVLTNGR